MAKRTGKKDAPASAPFQIPEVAPLIPADQIAASIPRPGEVTAGLPTKPKAKPPLPSGLYDYDPDELQRSRANQLGTIMTLERPARGRMTTLGTDLWGACAIANHLGNREPTKSLVTFSDDKTWCFIMPVHPETKKYVKVTYQNKVACINLWGPFQQLERVVSKGYKEYHELAMTDEPITIHGVTGYALYFSLTEYEEELISQRDESTSEPTGRVKVSKSGTKSAGSAKGSSTPAKVGEEAETGAPAAASPEAAAAPQAKEDLHTEIVDELTELIEEKDSEIDAIKAKLKAYEERFGQL